MQPGRHSAKVQRARSARSSQADVRRSREMEPLPKYSSKLKDGIVNAEEVEPGSPIANTLATRRTLATDAWMECSVALRNHDDANIQSWKEEIDTHCLVFADLFSAS